MSMKMTLFLSMHDADTPKELRLVENLADVFKKKQEVSLEKS